MKHCIVCGLETDRPIRSAFLHFHLYHSGQWQFLKGNMRAFGRWDGFWITIGLVCPAYDTIRHWRLRKARLMVGGKEL